MSYFHASYSTFFSSVCQILAMFLVTRPVDEVNCILLLIPFVDDFSFYTIFTHVCMKEIVSHTLTLTFDMSLVKNVFYSVSCCYFLFVSFSFFRLIVVTSLALHWSGGVTTVVQCLEDKWVSWEWHSTNWRRSTWHTLTTNNYTVTLNIFLLSNFWPQRWHFISQVNIFI